MACAGRSARALPHPARDMRQPLVAGAFGQGGFALPGQHGGQQAGEIGGRQRDGFTQRHDAASIDLRDGKARMRAADVAGDNFRHRPAAASIAEGHPRINALITCAGSSMLGDIDQLENLMRGATNPGALAEADIDKVRERVAI